MSVEYPFQNCRYTRRRHSFRQVGFKSAVDSLDCENREMLTNVGKSLILSGEENEKPESTRRSASPPKVNHFSRVTSCMPVPSLVDVRFRVRQLSGLQNDRTNERMTENDHITSALLTEVIIIIICHRPNDRVKIDRQDIFN